MFVIIVSYSKNKTRKYAMSIIDRYATRISSNVWYANLTEEGHNILKKELLNKSSKYLSVRAFRIYKRRELLPLWHIGNKNLIFDDKFIIKMKTETYPVEQSLACLISRISGLSHDLGKFTTMFQRKIRGEGDKSDNVRHEWISSYVFEQYLKRGVPKTIDDLKTYYPKKGDIAHYKPKFFKSGEFGDVNSVIIWLINSHHKLCGNEKTLNNLSNNSHVKKDSNGVLLVTDEELKLYANEQELKDLRSIFKSIDNFYSRIQNIVKNNNITNFKKIMILSRAGLILSDHTISSKEYPHNIKNNITCFANTKNKNNENTLDQPLIWHLGNVGRTAANMTSKLYMQKFRGLTEKTKIAILKPSPERYSWQDESCLYIEDIYKKTDKNIPCIVVNCASTGEGKTHANAKFAVTICENRNKPVRLFSALNLRTLTLQTGKEYKEFWNVNDDELLTIIGDDLIKKLHDKQHNEKEIYDEEDSEDSFVVIGGDNIDYNDLSYLDVVIERNPHMKKILNTPAVVSTIDYLSCASNPGKQANHAMALLALKDNVLILDEIDSYDPSALIDLSRIVEFAGMLNCDIILSSATIPKKILEYLFRAFHAGVYNSLQRDIKVPVVMVDENKQQGECYGID